MRKKVTIWNGIIEHEEIDPSSKANAILVTIDRGLQKFEGRREALLASLQEGRARAKAANSRAAHRNKINVLSEERVWRRLSNLAGQYLWSVAVAGQNTRPARRRTQLDQIAATLEKARNQISHAAETDVLGDLFSAWAAQTGKPELEVVSGADGSLRAVRLDDLFQEELKILEDLANSARTAAQDLKPPSGRPTGTALLPAGYISVLEDIFREATSSEPGAGHGPFARFAQQFLKALGRTIGNDGIVKAIQDARTPPNRKNLRRPHVKSSVKNRPRSG
jgi:hypothetical protein